MEQRRSKGKIAADIGLLFVLTVVLLIIGMYIPVLGLAAMMLWSVPVAYAVFRIGVKPAVVLSVFLAVALFLFFGIFGSFMTVGLCCVLGLFYGIRLKRKAPASNTLFMGIGIGILFGFVYAALAISIGGVSVTELRLSFEQEMLAAYAAYIDAGVLNEALLDGISMDVYITEMVSQMFKVLPSIFCVVIMAVCSVSYLVTLLFLKKRSYDVKNLPLFREWHLPWWILWGVVLALICFVGGNFSDSEILRIVAENILICYAPILLVSGISLVRYFCVQLHINDGIQALIWLFAAFFFSVSSIFLIVMGAGDAALDYRTGHKKKKNNDGGHAL